MIAWLGLLVFPRDFLPPSCPARVSWIACLGGSDALLWSARQHCRHSLGITRASLSCVLSAVFLLPCFRQYPQRLPLLCHQCKGKGRRLDCLPFEPNIAPPCLVLLNRERASVGLF